MVVGEPNRRGLNHRSCCEIRYALASPWHACSFGAALAGTAFPAGWQRVAFLCLLGLLFVGLLTPIVCAASNLVCDLRPVSGSEHRCSRGRYHSLGDRPLMHALDQEHIRSTPDCSDDACSYRPTPPDLESSEADIAKAGWPARRTRGLRRYAQGLFMGATGRSSMIPTPISFSSSPE